MCSQRLTRTWALQTTARTIDGTMWHEPGPPELGIGSLMATNSRESQLLQTNSGLITFHHLRSWGPVVTRLKLVTGGQHPELPTRPCIQFITCEEAIQRTKVSEPELREVQSSDMA